MPLLLRLPPVIVGAIILHTAVLPQLRVFGVAADLLLLVGIVAAIVAGPDVGGVVGFGAGLLADCFLQTPFGLSALVYGVVAYGVGSFLVRVLQPGGVLLVGLVAVASALGVALFAGIGFVLGEDQLVSGRLPTVVAVVAVLNGMLSLPAGRVGRWLAGARPSSALVLR